MSTTANFGLEGVRCRRTTFSMAVGARSVGANTDTLAEKWNGATWSVVSTPNAKGASESVINSVSCTTAAGGNFSLAVGESTDKTLVEKYS